MYKVVILLITLFFSTVATAIQTTVGKSTPAVAQTNVNITAVAIPIDKAGNVIIDSSNYHKAIQTGVEPVKPMTVVEISAPATSAEGHVQGDTPKSMIGEDGNDRGKKIISKTDRATQVVPK